MAAETGERVNAANSKEINKKRRIERIKAYSFKKGESGNPSGRPKRNAAQELSQEILELLHAKADRGKLLKALEVAIGKGNIKPFAEYSDRAYGKAPQSVNIEGN